VSKLVILLAEAHIDRQLAAGGRGGRGRLVLLRTYEGLGMLRVGDRRGVAALRSGGGTITAGWTPPTPAFLKRNPK
jgi:hypothetical protein